MIKSILQIGADPLDHDEVRLQKRLLVASTWMMATAAVLWGSLYVAFDEPLAGAIPLSYAAASYLSLFVFWRIRRYALFRFSQLLFSLLLPFFLMLALGGFIQSSGVVLWSLTSPLGALVFAGRKQAIGWFVAYLGLVVLGALLSSGEPNNLPPLLVTAFFVGNIGAMSVVVYVLVQAFANEQDLALVILNRQHQWVREAFSSYVSPNLVQHLIDNPDLLQLGGERRECSFVLTDIADFTMLVEQSDPALVVALLNDYLEGVTRIALQHDGTLDKIIGDAVAVLFSAPVPQEDHAERAVACALDIDCFANAFALERRQAGVPLGDTRIGVNSGDVIVGNVGSQSQLDYRALGDAINTASRLEGANRYFGTRICVGQETIDRCHDFIGRPIGSLLLKGKSEIVEAFEPWSRERRNETLLTRYNDAWTTLRNENANARATLETLRDAWPNDPLIAFYLDRLDHGLTGTTIVLDEK